MRHYTDDAWYWIRHPNMMDPRLKNLKMSHKGGARVQHFQPRVIIFDCRMTNYELLRWFAETPSRDVVHYRMINASRSTVCHYNDKRSRDDNQVWWTLLKMSALGLRPRATFSTSVRHIWMSHWQPCIICIVYANSVYIRPIVNSPACVLSRFNKRKSDSQSR